MIKRGYHLLMLGQKTRRYNVVTLRSTGNIEDLL